MITLRVMRPKLVAGHAAKGLAMALLALWTGAVIAGRLTAYPYFVEAWLGI